MKRRAFFIYMDDGKTESIWIGRMKRKRKKTAAFLTLAVMICLMAKNGAFAVGADEETYAAADREEEASEAEKELASQLHAKAAVLLDLDSGRVLYEKNGGEILPMASTTKIMTCITALEEGNMEEIVTASVYAAGQPKVHLGMQRGMRYRMEDLLYSLMLESHNDSAVAIAEHIGAKSLDLPAAEERTKEQSREAVKAFCDRMTEKARELGCADTCFLTPNGLDAEAVGEDGKKLKHSTTAEDLARLMRYCVSDSGKKDTFLEITRTQSHSFADAEGKRSYSCNNHNAFLGMMDGALSGKTGFTNQAGYCYVGALASGEERFAVALLACGWPNHKTWKWADCRKLFTYGMEQYAYREFAPQMQLDPVTVTNGASQDGNPYHTVSVPVEKAENILPFRLLVNETQQVIAEKRIRQEIDAPLQKGTQVGTVTYYLTDGRDKKEYLAQETLLAAQSVPEKSFVYVFRFLVTSFLVL